MSNEMGGVVQGLERKIKEGDLIVTKADKGNAVVMMEKSAYVSKVHEVLQQCGAKESEDFSFTNHVAEVRSVINNCEAIIKTPRMKKALLVPNPTPPFFTGCLKCIR